MVIRVAGVWREGHRLNATDANMLINSLLSSSASKEWHDLFSFVFYRKNKSSALFDVFVRIRRPAIDGKLLCSQRLANCLITLLLIGGETPPPPPPPHHHHYIKLQWLESLADFQVYEVNYVAYCNWRYSELQIHWRETSPNNPVISLVLSKTRLVSYSWSSLKCNESQVPIGVVNMSELLF